MASKIHPQHFKKVIIFLLIFLMGVAFGYKYFNQIKQNLPASQVAEKNTPRAFISEIYDKIKENYWDNLSDAQLVDFFRRALEQASGAAQSPSISTKEKFLEAVDKTLKGLDEDKKKKLTAAIAQNVLASLAPTGRSGLYTEAQETALKNTVSNINPEKDLYKDLGVAKGASEGAVAKAYEQKAEELKKDNSTQAQEDLKKIAYAKDVLTQKETKERYDEKGVEPAISSKLVTPSIVYLKFSKFSPTSLEELQQALNGYQNSSVDGLIFDLRGNVGGAIDATSYFLGFFIGKGQYAFDFYHKGEYVPFKTQTDKLAVLKKFKQVVVLIDNQTQSSAEMLASSIKKYNAGIVVGVPTKGWGTVERVFPLENQFDKTQKYSLFLVHSLTLRDDNLPIEGRGVDPHVNITQSDWVSQLYSYLRNQDLINAIKTVL